MTRGRRALVVLVATASSAVAQAAMASGVGGATAAGEELVSPAAADPPTSPLTLDFGGQLRFRFERDDGLTVKGYDPGRDDQLLLERLRLEVRVRAGTQAQLFLQLQDAHAFLTRLGSGDFRTSNPLEDTLDVRQLYVDWSHIGGTALGVRLGRQQISYGDQRVFGPGNWGNTGRFAWDAAMIKVDSSVVASDLWVGKYLVYQSRLWPDRPVDDFVTVVNYTQIKALPLRLDVFYVLKYDGTGATKGESGSGDLITHSLGAQAEGRWLADVLDAGATFVIQRGTYGRDRVSAAGANAKVGLTAPVAGRPRVGAQVTWGSGDANPTDGVHGTFDGVYGGRDIYFYGYLNLFFWANLRDYQAEVSIHPHPALTAFVDYHVFTLDERRDAWYTTGLVAYRRDPSGGSGQALADELDLRVVWVPLEHFEVMGGLGRAWPRGFAERTGAATAATWSFVQMAYSL